MKDFVKENTISNLINNNQSQKINIQKIIENLCKGLERKKTIYFCKRYKQEIIFYEIKLIESINNVNYNQEMKNKYPVEIIKHNLNIETNKEKIKSINVYTFTKKNNLSSSVNYILDKDFKDWLMEIIIIRNFSIISKKEK